MNSVVLLRGTAFCRNGGHVAGIDGMRCQRPERVYGCSGDLRRRLMKHTKGTAGRMAGRCLALALSAVMVLSAAGCGGKGGSQPSGREDVMITRRIYEAGELLGIRLFDHIVIGDNCFVSMKEKGFFGK